MPFTGDTFAHLFDWEKDPQRQEKIVNARLEAELDGIDTALTTVATDLSTAETTISNLVGPQYVVAASNATLTAERVLTDTATVTWDFSVAGQAKATATVTDTNSTVIGGNGGTGTVAGGATAYLGPSGLSTTEGNVYFPLPVACTLTALRVVGNDPGVGQTASFTARKTIADTAIVATITSGTNVANASGSVSFAAGDRFAVKITPSATANTQGPVSFGALFTIP